MKGQSLVSNVLIAGKTGVGKSAFLNYIYGENVAASRAGSPVTAKGFHEYVLRDDTRGVTFRFFDTWGLEANRSEEWHESIVAAVREREQAVSVAEWFHTVYYLFSINSGRVERYEIEDVLRPLVRQRSNVIVVLTNYNPDSTLNVEKAEAMEAVLIRELGFRQEQLIRVNSVEKKLLNGQTIPLIGYEDIWRQNRTHLWKTIEDRLPQNVTTHLFGELEAWKERSLQSIKRIRTLTPQVLISRRAYRIRQDLDETIMKAARLLDDSFEEAIMIYIQLMERYPNVSVTPVIRTDLPFRFDYSATKTAQKMIVGMVPFVQFVYWTFKRKQAERAMKRAVLEQYEHLRHMIEFDVRPKFAAELTNFGKTLHRGD